MTTKNTIYQVDAFTTSPFKGNPAGVCILDKEADTGWMQNVAMEMNLSETTFVVPKDDHYNIRYFTPVAEMKLCGHATLSAAHIMYETGIVPEDKIIKFLSKAGELIIRKKEGWITMDFPVYTLKKIDITSDFEKLTGVKPQELYETGLGWTLALTDSEQEVLNMKPDFTGLKNSPFGDLIVTAISDDRAYDFCVRCFAPVVGIDEDPVTGSAHCALAPFWSAKTGKSEFMSHQISRREGILKISMKGNRVEISGQAVTIFKAVLFV